MRGALRSQQRGLSGAGLLFMLIVLALVLLTGLKLIPLYLESFKVDHALQGVVEEPSVATQSKREIAYSVVRRLDIDGAYRIKESNWKDYLSITKVRDQVTIKAAWRAETKLVGNLSLVASFDKEVSNRP